MIGHIFDIQRFCVHDGPGIRTTVFFKGCPLHCLWCHNPESQISELNIAYYDSKCLFCKACVTICPSSCHNLIQVGEQTGRPQHLFDRRECKKCGACAAACPSGAIEALGRKVTVDEIISEVQRDQNFYKNSGGGLTVSGGEPLLQHRFLLSLLKAAKEKGIHTCVETCGYARAEVIKSILPYTDLFLFDIKETDDTRHKIFTGVSFAPILENLRLMDSLGAKIILRLPLIPEKNLRNSHLEHIAALSSELCGLSEIHIMAYHTLGSSKYAALGIKDEMHGATPMSAVQKDAAIAFLKNELTARGISIPIK